MEIDLRGWKGVDLKKHKGRKVTDGDVRISVSNSKGRPSRVVITFYNEFSDKMYGRFIKPYVLEELGIMCFVEDEVDGATVSRNSSNNATMSRIAYTTEWFLLFCLDKTGYYKIHYDNNKIPYIYFKERKN